MIKRYFPQYMQQENQMGRNIDYYQHQSMINDNRILPFSLYPTTNPNIESRSGLYNVLNNYSQPPANFLGAKAIRPPPNDSRTFKPVHPYIPEELGVPIMKPRPIPKIYNVISC